MLAQEPRRRFAGKVPPAAPRTPAPPRAGWRLWALRLAMAVLSPVLFLGLVESGLGVGGYGHPTAFFVKTADGAGWVTNAHFGRQFFPAGLAGQPWPAVLAAHKPPGTVRIFVLGESAAMGTPDPSFGFARILEVMLRQQFPARKFEVVNAAMRGINSHVILPIARDCAAHEPDLFIAYMGHNEAVGLYAPEPGAPNLAAHPALLRMIQRAKMTRLAQLLKSAAAHLGNPPPEVTQDMAFYRRKRLAADDPRRTAVRENFLQNLRAIGQTAHDSGAPLILATVPVNLRDCPPLASLHRADLAPADAVRWDAAFAGAQALEQSGARDAALAAYSELLRTDDHFADLHFCLARALAAGGDWEKARAHFALARDWDAMQFRADSQLNRIIRDTAREASGVHLADAEQALTPSPRSADDVPGARLFYEHVHLRFDGDYLVAQTLLPQVIRALALGEPAAAAPTRDDCARALAFTEFDEMDMLSAIATMTSLPPFLDQLGHAARQAAAERTVRERVARFDGEAVPRATARARAAVERRPDDWQLRYVCGRMLFHTGDPAGAAEHLAAAVRLMPEDPATRLELANALTQLHRPAEAAAQLREVLRLEPGNASARAGLEALETPAR